MLRSLFGARGCVQAPLRRSSGALLRLLCASLQGALPWPKCAIYAPGDHHGYNHGRQQPEDQRPPLYCPRVASGQLRVLSPDAFTLPGIVCTEVPDMTFGIAACVAAPAKVIILYIYNYLGAGGLGSSVVCIRIADQKIAALCLGAADLIRLLHVFGERGVAYRGQHEHRVAEGQLRVVHDPSFAAGNEVLLEPESGAQPIARRSNIAIPHRSCNTRHRGPNHVFDSVSGAGSQGLPRVAESSRAAINSVYVRRSKRTTSIGTPSKLVLNRDAYMTAGPWSYYRSERQTFNGPSGWLAGNANVQSRVGQVLSCHPAGRRRCPLRRNQQPRPCRPMREAERQRDRRA